ncbi:MAG: SMP-30/Gluconolaconase/LRE domain protein, partial [Verrucomicrobiaceae bacterium]|nr:SMP-30/Gluconolaconase/LRE domain protein [Verrucomicrobiaceae bacterium]
MTTHALQTFTSKTSRLIQCGVWLLGGLGAGASFADDWGAYTLTPASAPLTVLEAVGTGTTEGTLVSIGKPAGTPNQKWVITAKGDDLYAIRPVSSPTLVLAVAKGGVNNGTPIVLETESGKPSQQWHLQKNDNATYSLVPQHAPDKGIDDQGGKKEPGSKIDLWDRRANDQHLQWLITPLAGNAPAPTAAEGEAKGYVPPEIKPEDILAGEIKTFKFTASAIFPGTVRDVTVFIPKQYDGSKPACVYVKTDGYNPREKVLMETMIATKEMPVTIGVFIKPG